MYEILNNIYIQIYKKALFLKTGLLTIFHIVNKWSRFGPVTILTAL